VTFCSVTFWRGRVEDVGYNFTAKRNKLSMWNWSERERRRLSNENVTKKKRSLTFFVSNQFLLVLKVFDSNLSELKGSNSKVLQFSLHERNIQLKLFKKYICK
jgi:hypothetical protein